MVLGLRTVSQSQVRPALFKVSFQPVNTGRAPILFLKLMGQTHLFRLTILPTKFGSYRAFVMQIDLRVTFDGVVLKICS